MKTIKFVDIRYFDTDATTIAAHLTDSLKRIRKNKLAADLIGDDDNSDGLKSSDPDGFADKLSAGVELTYRGVNRHAKLTPYRRPNLTPLGRRDQGLSRRN